MCNRDGDAQFVLCSWQPGEAYGGEGGDEVAFLALGHFFALLQIPGVERLGGGGDAGSLDSQAFCHGLHNLIRGVV